MSNIFSNKMKDKSDKDLLYMLENPKYFQKLAIEAAAEELNSRELSEADKKVVTQTTQTLNEYPEANARMLQPAKLVWVWFPGWHLYDLVSYYMLLFLVLLFFSFPFFSEWFFWIFFIFSPFIPLWQSNIISGRKTRRYNHIQARAFYSIMIVLILSARAYFTDDGSMNAGLGMVLFLLFFTTTGIISLPLYHLDIKLFRNRKYYFLKRLRPALWISPVLLFPLIVLEENWFNPYNGTTVQWNDTHPITFADFQGYPDLFTNFDAAILSEIDYKFRYSDNNELEYVNAICHKGESWVNPWSDDSYFLIQHERYHFNITEMVTRMLRKDIYEAQQRHAEREEIKSILREHIRKLHDFQASYDTQTNHSLVEDMQSRWQYYVDSTLATLDPYWTSDMLHQPELTEPNVKYFRGLDIPTALEIQGIHELMPFEQNYVDCYKFTYAKDNKAIERIDHFFQGRQTNDHWYKVATILISRPTENETIWMFLDADSKPMLSKGGYHYKTIRQLKNGLQEISYFDLSGKACATSDGVFKTRVQADSLNRQVEKRFFNSSGKQMVNSDGHYTLKYAYVSRGYSSTETIRNYGPGEQPLADATGAFERTFYFDSERNYLGISHKDIQEKPLYINGHYRTEYRYNLLGNTMATRYLDENDRLVEDSNGIAMLTYSADRYGNENRISYYNANEVLTLNKDGFATTYTKYDAQNHVVSEGHYDTGDVIIFDEKGYGKTDYIYDSLGRNNMVINYNGYYFPVASNEGGPAQLYAFDSLDRVIEDRYYDEANLPYATEAGEAYCTYGYDADDHVVEIRCFGLDGQPAATQYDVSIFRYTYDERGNKTETRYFTVDDKPALASQDVSINRYVYSEDGLMTERTYYDTLGRLKEFDGSAIIRWTYDARGNETETNYLNRYELPLDSGLVRITKTYDAQNRLVEENDYYNYPETNEDRGPAQVKLRFDANQKVVAKYNYDSEGNPCLDEDQVHLYQYDYYEGVTISERYYNTNEELTPKYGLAQVEFELDNRGNKVWETYYDELGNRAADSTGVASIHNTYDRYDRIILQQFYDTDNLLTQRKERYAIIYYKRNRSGHVVEKSYYNTLGALTENEDSVALYTNVYNRNGYLEENKLFALDEVSDFKTAISSDFIRELGGVESGMEE